jgi:hypothetical protein
MSSDIEDNPVPEDMLSKYAMKVYAELDAISLPHFELHHVDVPRQAGFKHDFDRDIIEVHFPTNLLEQNHLLDTKTGMTLPLSTAEAEMYLQKIIKKAMIKAQFHYNTMIDTIDDVLAEDEDIYHVYRSENDAYWKNQPGAIHTDPKFAARYLGKLGFLISNGINRYVGGAKAKEYGYHIRKKGLVENLVRAMTNEIYDVGEELLWTWKKSPIGIDFGDANRQVKYLSEVVEEQGWKTILNNFDKWMIRTHQKHPSYDPDEHV